MSLLPSGLQSCEVTLEKLQVCFQTLTGFPELCRGSGSLLVLSEPAQQDTRGAQVGSRAESVLPKRSHPK